MPHEILAKVNTQIKSPVLNVSHSESPALYSSHTIKTFAQSLIGLFIPIYIFTLPNIPKFTGNPVTDGFLLILVFYLLRSIFALSLMNFITNTIFGFLNFKKSIFLANIFLAVATILLALSPFSLFFLLFSTIAFAVETTLYWIPFHLFFIRKASSKSGQYGHTFAIQVLTSQLGSAFAPLIGGIIITYLGFIALFATGTTLIVASAFSDTILYARTQSRKTQRPSHFHAFNKIKVTLQRYNRYCFY
jgi:MFS family permease